MIPEVNPVKRYYGLKKQKVDARDYIYKAPMAVVVALPKKVSLTLYDSPIENQGGLGACTAFATCGAMQLLEIKQGAPGFKLLAFIELGFMKVARAVLNFFRIINWYAGNLSKLFVYYNARAIEGTADSDSGAELRDVIKGVVTYGACNEQDWWYNEPAVTLQPSLVAYSDAKKNILKEYRALETLDDMRGCLADGSPFVFGFIVYNSFEFGSINQTGIVEMPKDGEAIIASHGVCCVGYDDNKKLFKCRNSWGNKWGKGGYFYMPYDYITKYGFDFWMLKMEGK